MGHMGAKADRCLIPRPAARHQSNLHNNGDGASASHGVLVYFPATPTRECQKKKTTTKLNQRSAINKRNITHRVAQKRKPLPNYQKIVLNLIKSR